MSTIHFYTIKQVDAQTSQLVHNVFPDRIQNAIVMRCIQTPIETFPEAETARKTAEFVERFSLYFIVPPKSVLTVLSVGDQREAPDRKALIKIEQTGRVIFQKYLNPDSIYEEALESVKQVDGTFIMPIES